MLENISNTVASLPIASIGCAAAGLFIGRKFGVAAFYKAGSITANLFKSEKASAWNEASKESLLIAKKDGIRDLTAAASLIAISLSSGRAQEKDLPKEETGYFQNYGLPASKAAIVGSIGWMLKKYQVSTALKNSIVEILLDGKIKPKFDMKNFKANI